VMALKGAVGLLRSGHRPRRGIIIVLEGPDKTGKTTQWRLLTERLERLGIPCTRFEFPAYHTPIGKEIKAQLAKMTLSPVAFQGLQTINRAEMATAIQNDLDLGRVVVMNRYIESALVYGIFDDPTAEVHIRRMSSVLPQSDLVIILDAPPWTLDGDFYEKPERQDRIRTLYRRQAERNDWAVVDARASQQAVHEAVWEIVAPVLRERLTDAAKTPSILEARKR